MSSNSVAFRILCVSLSNLVLRSMALLRHRPKLFSSSSFEDIVVSRRGSVRFSEGEAGVDELGAIWRNNAIA